MILAPYQGLVCERTPAYRVAQVYEIALSALPVAYANAIPTPDRSVPVCLYRDAVILFVYQVDGGFGFISHMAALLNRHHSTIISALRRVQKRIKHPDQAEQTLALIEKMKRRFEARKAV